MKWTVVFSILLTLVFVLQVLIYIEMISNAFGSFASLANKTEDQKALMTYVTHDGGINEYNSSEFLIDLTLYNYGYSEARNVVTACEFYYVDEDGNIMGAPFDRFTQNTGNVASTSYKEVQVSTTISSAMNNFTDFSCNVYSCENCILLDDRILEQ